MTQRKIQLNNIFLPYQKEWINDRSKYIICQKSRRIGITWAEAFRVCKLFATGAKRDYYYIAQNEGISHEFIRQCLKFADGFNTIFGEEIFDLKKSTKTIIYVKGSKFKIEGLTSNPTTLRGRGGDITIDEFAFHENPEELFKAALPITMWGGALRIISTHMGNTSYFYKLLKENNGEFDKFKKVSITIEDAVEQGLAMLIKGPHHKATDPNKAFIESLKKGVSEEIWSQEYLCKPLSGSQKIISGDIYDKLAIANPSFDTLPTHTRGPIFVGIDVAASSKSSHKTVCWFVEEIIDEQQDDEILKKCYNTICVLILEKLNLDSQLKRIIPLLQHPQIMGVCIDATGVGQGLSQPLVNKYDSMVDPVFFNARNKVDMAENIRYIAQTDRITFPSLKDNISNLIREDILSVALNNNQYEGNSQLGHGDSFWALALALRAAKKNYTQIF